MATGQTSHVTKKANKCDDRGNSLPVILPTVGSEAQVLSNGSNKKTMTASGTDIGTKKQPENNESKQLNHGDSTEKCDPPSNVPECHESNLNQDFDISGLTCNGGKNGLSGNETYSGICNGEVNSTTGEAMGNNIRTGCIIGSTDDIKTPNGFIVGNGGMDDQTTNTTKAQAVRPKTITWSRLVKQRKDKKEKNKKQNNVMCQNQEAAYLYPEMYSSSEDDMDDMAIVPTGNSNKTLGRPDDLQSPAGAKWNFQLGHEWPGCSRSCMPNHRHKMDTKPKHRSGQSFHSSGLFNGDLQSSLSSCNSTDSTRTENSTYPPFNPVLMVTSDCLLAPLAMPEDSGGSSLSSGSESNFNPDDFCCDNIDSCSASYNNEENGCSTQSQPSQVLQITHNISCEENMPKLEPENKSPVMPFPPAEQFQQLPRPASVDSLDEIGDYIETDFPSQASRLLFACSSNSSSSSSSDEDEGYGVNAEPRIPNLMEQEEDKNALPILPSEPLPFRRKDINGHREDESESRVLFLNDSPSDLKLCDRFVGHACSKDNSDAATGQTKQLSRLGSSTSAGESGSEVGGQMGSDSSVVYSPEADYMEFVDSDLPASLNGHSFSFPRDPEVLSPFLSEGQCYPNDCDRLHHASLANSCEDMLEQVAEASASLTNNLNYDRCCGELDDNMERYDPHLHVDNENFHVYCNPDLCKQEKVPRANFQNSASNQQEKIFYKAALDREHQSLSGSSDEEENVAQSFMRDPNVEGEDERRPQNSNTECMYIEDLENLTHALQNAVIMQLPPKLEESSGESSDEPIYEEIECLEPFGSAAHSGDGGLHVVKEEAIKTADNVARVLPKFERHRRRGNKPHCHVEKVMIWNEYEAYVLQVKQIGTSACGPTAILNVMKAFDYQVDKEEICKKITANLRMEAAPIPYYLFSRSTAGTTADNLLDGVQKLTKGAIRGRFFHFYPPRKVELLKWLGYWMKKGAVPIATLNLQKGVKPGWTIPDAWHHQMVYGVGSKGIYLTNPLEIVPEETIMDQLTSDSVLLVRRQDVVNRFRDWAPLNDFLKQKDQRWQTMNVLGQVVNVLREACTALSHQIPRHRAQLTSHITIPAAYKAGVTLFVRQNSEVAQELFCAQELELKDGSEIPTEVFENGTINSENSFMDFCSDGAASNPS